MRLLQQVCPAAEWECINSDINNSTYKHGTLAMQKSHVFYCITNFVDVMRKTNFLSEI